MARKPEDLQEAHRRRKKRESLLETLESIVVAFVLAFIFRAFIVEAFVIPTGSMAPTLDGAHAEFKCPNCGYRFAMGVEGRARQPRCPNCFQSQPLPPGGVSLYSGDRVLVLKFLYDFEEPRRWDVIVFRNPNDPSQNYIKRLVALPGETIELVGGNVTIDGQIVQKTDRAQEALWMLVHDTRYRPARSDWVSRWAPFDPGWTESGSGFHMQPAQNGSVGIGAETAWLTYHHRAPDGRPSNIRDFYAYNSGGEDSPFGDNVCTDLALRGEVTVADSASQVIVELTAYKDRFRFEMAPKGSVLPTRILVNGQPVAEAPAGVLPVGRSVPFLAADVDHKLMLLVGGDRVAKPLAEHTTPEGDPLYEPTPLAEDERGQMDAVAGAAASVRIGACGGPVTLAYLRLDRDVYYTNARAQESLRPRHGTEGHPFHLGQDEFFVLGDNSPSSADCRLWTLPRPVVPRRNLVGKALFVYWPAAGPRTSLRIPILPDPRGWRFVH